MRPPVATKSTIERIEVPVITDEARKAINKSIADGLEMSRELTRIALDIEKSATNFRHRACATPARATDPSVTRCTPPDTTQSTCSTG